MEERTLQHGEALPEPKLPDRVGPYLLLERIAEGGMGEVWLAEQSEPVRRRVALKFIKPGMDTRRVLARFDSERQALALMEHPAIARVFDGGTTPAGRPFFAMEYVSGIAITEHCDRHKLTIHARLDLFLELCAGVQHAHQKAILHRDLKPSNVLVALVDGAPQVKIIDFGIAKALAQPLTGEPLVTEVGALLGTPEYMSPEQADLGRQDLDTRTDVYSLGVMLYELLSGALPFSRKELQTSSSEELRRVIREVEATPPSRKLSTLGDRATDIAQTRRSLVSTLERELRGDLDAVVLKALEKDRARRYGSVAELAADIERYLRHETVLARPAGSLHRASKFVRRHRVGVAVAAASALLLPAFTISLALQVRRVSRERDRANRLAQFMKDMFRVSSPSEARGKTITVREVLDQAALTIDRDLAQDPEQQAEMLATMGGVYQELGLLGQAEELIAHALALRRRVLGPEHPATLASMSSLVGPIYERGRLPEAEKLARETLELQERILGAEDAATLVTLNALGAVLSRQGRHREALDILQRVWQARRRVLGLDAQVTIQSATNVAGSLHRLGRLAEAEQASREALAAKLRIFGPDHPTTLTSQNNLAYLLMDEHKLPEAEPFLRSAVEGSRRVLGPEHPDTLARIGHLALCLSQTGRLDEAEKLQREVLAIQTRVHAEPDALAISKYNLACIAVLRKDPAGAIALLQEAVAHGLPTDFALQLGNDPDLAPLRGDPAFQELLAEARRRSGK